MSVPSAEEVAGKVIIGIDEAGRGPLAGPVVAAGVVLDDNNPIAGLDDSKKLTAKTREKLYAHIMANARLVCIAQADAACIDQINILQATLLSMSKVLQDAASRMHIDLALIDGRDIVKTNSSIAQKAIIKGDSLVPSIMAASIIAKVFRDRLMDNFDHMYPNYGFASHKGYATKAHVEALENLGPCAIHRRSFTLIGQQNLL